MAQRLTDLIVNEASLVDRPANDHARVLLWKRDSSDDEAGEEEQIQKLLTPEVRKALEDHEHPFTYCMTNIVPKTNVSDPEAFCANLVHEATGKWPTQKSEPALSDVHVDAPIGAMKMAGKVVRYRDGSYHVHSKGKHVSGPHETRKDAVAAVSKKSLIEKLIRKESNGKWCVYSEDGSKRLGSYDTKAEAVARLAQVEGHKMKKAVSEGKYEPKENEKANVSPEPNVEAEIKSTQGTEAEETPEPNEEAEVTPEENEEGEPQGDLTEYDPELDLGIMRDGDNWFIVDINGNHKGGPFKQKIQAQEALRVRGGYEKSDDSGDDNDEVDIIYKQGAGMPSDASKYAYAPDKDHPSTWKLPIHDAAHVGAAAAALGPGYRGSKVSIPANARAGVVARVRAAWKKFNPDKESDEMPNVLKSDADLEAEEVEKAGRKISASRLAKLKQTHRALGAMINEQDPKYHPGGMEMTEAEKSADQEDVLKAKKKKMAEGSAEEEAAESAEEAAAEGDSDTEDMGKRIAKIEKSDPGLAMILKRERERLAKAEARIKDAEDIAKSERDLRLTMEYTAIAKKDLAGLPGTVEEKVADIRKLYDRLDKADADKMVDNMRKAATAIRTSSLFKEEGSQAGGGTVGDAAAQLEALAKARQSDVNKSGGKDGKPLSFAKAYDEILKENPDLYKQYVTEQRERAQRLM